MSPESRQLSNVAPSPVPNTVEAEILKWGGGIRARNYPAPTTEGAAEHTEFNSRNRLHSGFHDNRVLVILTAQPQHRT